MSNVPGPSTGQAPPPGPPPPPPPPPEPQICPPGLEPLIGISHIFVKQAVNMMEMFFNMQNHYDVITNTGVRIYHVTETTDAMTRMFDSSMGGMPFRLIVLGFAGQPVLSLLGQPDYCGSPGGISVAYGGRVIGNVNQVSGACGGTASYHITNSQNVPILTIHSQQDTCCMGCGGTADFNVCSADGKSVVGRISKMWSGFIQEIYSNADNFGVSFPPDMDVLTKAILMGTTIMIDFQFFNESQQRSRRGLGGFGYGGYY